MPKGAHLISISMYLPEFDEAYNLPFYHGEGEIDVPSSQPTEQQVRRMTWQGKRKKQLLKDAFWPDFKQTYDFENMSDSDTDIVRKLIKVYSPGQTWVFFNASFDVHFLNDFATGDFHPGKIEDVQELAHLIFEDWGNKLLANTPVFPDQPPGFALKALCKYWEIEDAATGEAELEANAVALEQAFAKYIERHWQQAPVFFEAQPSFDEVFKKVTINSKSEMWMLPSSEVAYYAIMDVILTWRLREKLYPMLKAWNQEQLYADQNAAHLEVFCRMERTGVPFDNERAEELLQELEGENEAIKEWFDTKYNVNPASPKQLLDLVATEYGIEWPSTSKADLEALQQYAEEQGLDSLVDIIEPILTMRHNTRAASTYIKKWQGARDKDGNVHFNFRPYGAVTGRTKASSGPQGDSGNAQNSPARGFRVRDTLVAPPGWWMIQGDFSQIELRIAAWTAKCKSMIAAFNSGVDVHSYTRDQMRIAQRILPYLFDGEKRTNDLGLLSQALEYIGTKHEVTTPEEAWYEIDDWGRKYAKTCNFGLLYNGTHYLLAHLLHITPEEALPVFNAWHELYPEISIANADRRNLMLTPRPAPDGTGRGFMYNVQPLSGRARKATPYPAEKWIKVDVPHKDPVTENVVVVKEWKKIYPREEVAKKGFNSEVQGLGNYFLWQSNLRCCRAYDESVYRPWAHIHDSNNFFLKMGHERLLLGIKEKMEDWPTDPPQVVEFEVSPTGRWQDLAPVKYLEDWIADPHNYDYTRK